MREKDHPVPDWGELQVWNWMKVGLEVAKKQYLTDLKGSILNSGGELELQISGKRKR